MTTFLERGPDLEQAALDHFYRTDREFRGAALVLSLAGSLAIFWEYRAIAFGLFATSVVCQIISARAMRAAQRLEKRRIERIEGGHG